MLVLVGALIGGVVISRLPRREGRIGSDPRCGKCGYIVRGIASPHGLGMHPPSGGASHVEYQLGKRFRRFVGKVAINDSSNGSQSPLTFKVLGDGNELWKSRAIQAPRMPAEFHIDVTNVDILQIVVDCPGDHGAAHAVWFEPEVLP